MVNYGYIMINYGSNRANPGQIRGAFDGPALVSAACNRSNGCVNAKLGADGVDIISNVFH